MKKFLPIILVLAVVGVGAYLYLQKGGGTSEIPLAGEIFKGTLETAISKGVPFKCEFTDEGTTVTTLVKGEKVYTESKIEGKMQYSILKDNCTWSWDETGQQAVKYCFEEVDYEDFDPASDDTVSTTNPDVGETETPEYNCVPTTISDAKFEPPADINFMSF